MGKYFEKMTDSSKITKLFGEILYKYRDWNNEYHKKILTDYELYFPSFEKLNDLFDGHLPFRYENENIDKNTYKDCLKKDNKFEYQQLTKKDIGKMFRKFKSGRDWKEMLPSHIANINEIYGLYCLSSSCIISAQWAHYGANHEGFCVGFKTNELYKIVQGIFGRINYSNNPVKIPFCKSNVYEYQNLFFIKSKDWEYEDEVRILKTDASNKTFKLNRTSIAEIIFGKRMKAAEKETIMGICRNNFDDISFFNLEEDYDKMTFVKVPINN